MHSTRTAPRRSPLRKRRGIKLKARAVSSGNRKRWRKKRAAPPGSRAARPDRWRDRGIRWDGRPRAVNKPIRAEDWRSGFGTEDSRHKAVQFIALRRTLAFRRLFYLRMDTPARYANFIVPVFDSRQSKRRRLIKVGASYAPLMPHCPRTVARTHGVSREPQDHLTVCGSLLLSTFVAIITARNEPSES